MSNEIAIQDLIALAVPVPPNPILEAAFGYESEEEEPGEATLRPRYVAFCWEPSGDEMVYDDGRSSGDGDWQGYLIFTQHKLVWPTLKDFNLGSSEERATHRLLLDRKERKLYIGANRPVGQILHKQWDYQASPFKEMLNPDQIEELLRRIQEEQNRLEANLAEFELRLEAYREKTFRAWAALIEWLELEQQKHL